MRAPNQMNRNNPLCQTEILILESNHIAGDSLSISLPNLPYIFKKVNSAEEILKALELKDYAVILLNAGSNCAHIPDLIRTIKRKSSETVIIVVANQLNRSVAVDAIN